MKILVVSHHVPLPTSGIGARNYYLLRALARAHDVALFAIANEDEFDVCDAPPVTQFVRVAWVGKVPLDRHKRLSQATAVLRGKSYLLAAHSLPAAQRALDDELARQHYDAVLFEGLLVTSYRIPAGIRTIIDQHNIEHELLWRIYKQGGSLPRQTYNWLESQRLKSYELARCASADLVLVTSERERTVLRRAAPEARVRVVPNGVDIATYDADHGAREVPGRAVFVATYSYHPNVQAVLHFAQRIWPRIHAEMPEATWQIVGRDPPPAVRALDGLSGISVTGMVPDVQPYLKAAQVVIAPLLAGGGTRLKILEALAARKAVVSTTLGCEGLAIVPERHLLVADEPEAFADAVVSLLRDPARRAALGAAGRDLVERQYGWESCGTQLVEALSELEHIQENGLESCRS